MTKICGLHLKWWSVARFCRHPVASRNLWPVWFPVYAYIYNIIQVYIYTHYTHMYIMHTNTHTYIIHIHWICICSSLDYIVLYHVILYQYIHCNTCVAACIKKPNPICHTPWAADILQCPGYLCRSHAQTPWHRGPAVWKLRKENCFEIALRIGNLSGNHLLASICIYIYIWYIYI